VPKRTFDPYADPADHPLGTEAWFLYNRIGRDAAGTRKGLRQSWQRPVRHNLTIERGALYSALYLDRDAVTVMADDRLLQPSHVDVQTRHEFAAGVLLVHRLLPFSEDERARLRGPTWMLDDRWVPEAVEREPELVDRWHKWVWTDEHGIVQRAASTGASGVLAIACGQLVTTLHQIGRIPS
jgi:hypothetical protein